MATQRGNLAYDISVYEPKPKQPETKQPQIKVKKNTNVQPQSAKSILLTAAVVLAMMFAMLYGKGELGRSIEISVMCGYDTDCNASNIGTILGVLGGCIGLVASVSPDLMQLFNAPDEVLLTGLVAAFVGLLAVYFVSYKVCVGIYKRKEY